MTLLIFGHKVFIKDKTDETKFHEVMDEDASSGMFYALKYDEKEILRVARDFHRTLRSSYLGSREFSLLLTLRHVIPLDERLRVWKISVTFQVRESEDDPLPRSIKYFGSSRPRDDPEVYYFEPL